MKIRRETDYAIRAIHALANVHGEALLSKEIASKENIPQTYILTIMSVLKNAEIVTVVRRKGESKGGYVLRADLNDISLYDVVHAFEGEIAINTCLKNKDDCACRKKCKMRKEMNRINEELINQMKKNSIQKVFEDSIETI
jgi:Rrf2 family protein